MLQPLTQHTGMVTYSCDGQKGFIHTAPLALNFDVAATCCLVLHPLYVLRGSVLDSSYGIMYLGSTAVTTPTSNNSCTLSKCKCNTVSGVKYACTGHTCRADD